MFAKVFGQIFDSSIAEDYTVRHMFIDLLILADATGAVDMTHDAISRRTNVPLETVERCIAELCQPDVNSRSTLHDGKRIVPLDSHRNWGWQIVNYKHYRTLRDEEARRSYFRDYQRKRRSKEKNVKDKKVDKGDGVEIPSSPSTSSSKQRPSTEKDVLDDCAKIELTPDDGHYFWDHWQANGFTNNKSPMKDWEATIRSWKRAGHCPSQKQQAGTKRMSAFDVKQRIEAINDELNRLYKGDREANKPERNRLNNLKYELEKSLVT